MTHHPEDELVRKCQTAKDLFQDYTSKITYGEKELASYHKEQANFWLTKYRTLKEELDDRDHTNPKSV